MHKLKLGGNILNELNKDFNLSFHLRYLNLEIWNSILEKSNYLPFLYTNASICYQELYRNSLSCDYIDLSSIINFKGEYVGLLNLGVCKIDGKYFIFSQSFNGLYEPPPIDKPIFINISERLEKKLSLQILEIIKILSKVLGVKEWKTADNFDGNKNLSTWHLASMQFGSKSDIFYELFVDLRQNINTIKSQFRKSYKSLIYEEKYNLKTSVMKKNEEVVWNEFKNMHFISAGRITRSDKSWRAHYEDIINNCGILIYVRDSKGYFLGGGFFNYTRDEATYAVAAYDRSRFELPIGHIVQYKAIKEFKKKGIKWYKIGHLPFEGDEFTPSKKYLNIGNFKKGFATNIFPKYVFKNINN